jgi:predicted nucleotidyltransferase
MSPEQVLKARDYALAELADMLVGKIGFSFIVAAALASTSSAINATLYGTARISYMVAKYGELPKVMEKRLWSRAYEGLIIISLLSLMLALLAPLETISVAGSGAFLIIFTGINYAAYKLRVKIGSNSAITIAGVLLTLFSLATLVYRVTTTSPSALTVFIMLIAGSILLEYIYRKYTGRGMPKYVDKRLEAHERLIDTWHMWLPKLAGEIRKIVKEAEIYLVGSIARGERHKANDVDILIVTPKELTVEEKELISNTIVSHVRPPLPHTVDVHYATREEREKALRKSRKYRKIVCIQTRKNIF